MVVPDWVVQGKRLVAIAPRVAGPGIAIDDDGWHAELAQPRAESDAALPASDDHRVRLGDMAEVLGLVPALLEPGLPIRDGAMLGSLGSPVTLRLLMASEIVQCRQQRPGFAVSEPEMTYAAADRGFELYPALGFPARLAELVSDGETARLNLIERLTEHVSYPFDTLHSDDVPGERDQVAPVAVINEQAGCRINVTGGQGSLEVCQPPGHCGSCSRGVDRLIRGGLGHQGTPIGGGLEVQWAA